MKTHLLNPLTGKNVCVNPMTNNRVKVAFKSRDNYTTADIEKFETLKFDGACKCCTAVLAKYRAYLA